MFTIAQRQSGANIWHSTSIKMISLHSMLPGFQIVSSYCVKRASPMIIIVNFCSVHPEQFEVAELILYHIQGYTFKWTEWESWSGCSWPCKGSDYNRTRSRPCISRENEAIVEGSLCEAAYPGEVAVEVETCGQGACSEGKTTIPMKIHFSETAQNIRFIW